MAELRRILVVRVGRGGDVVMITPALRALLAACPEAEIHLLTQAEGARVLRGFDERITRIWTYHRSFPGRLLLERRLDRDLGAENYDAVFCFETRDIYRRWLGGMAPACYSLDQSPPTAHFAAGCLDLVEAAVGKPVARGWLELPVSDEGRARARALLDENGIDRGSKLVGLHATYSGSRLPVLRERHGRRHRQWSSAHWAEVGRLLKEGAEQRGLPLAVVVDVLPEEVRLVAPIAEASGGAVKLLGAPPDFERYKGLLAELDVLISPNTGPMHMAAAVGTHVVALFSGWSAADCGPYVPADRQDVLTPPAGDEKLDAITPQVVASVVLDRLGS